MQKKRLIMFLSTGNICRSPMAMGYFNYLLEQKKIKHIEVRSAGVMTIPGLLATPESLLMLEPYGVDMTKHRSLQLTKDMIKRADLILGMTPFHVQSALRESDMARDKTFLLKEYTKSDLKNYQINDPMGCTMEVYKKIFNEIKNACNKLLQIELTKPKVGKRGRKKKEQPAPPAPKPIVLNNEVKPEEKEEDIEKLREETKAKLKNIYLKFQRKSGKAKLSSAKTKEHKPAKKNSKAPDKTKKKKGRTK